MKSIDKQFWIEWTMFLLLSTATSLSLGRNADTAALCGAYALSLAATAVCLRTNPREALYNIVVMLLYNAPLSYCLLFMGHGGAGLTWWFLTLLLNALHSITILIYSIAHHRPSPHQ